MNLGLGGGSALFKVLEFQDSIESNLIKLLNIWDHDDLNWRIPNRVVDCRGR